MTWITGDIRRWLAPKMWYSLWNRDNCTNHLILCIFVCFHNADIFVSLPSIPFCGRFPRCIHFRFSSSILLWGQFSLISEKKCPQSRCNRLIIIKHKRKINDWEWPFFILTIEINVIHHQILKGNLFHLLLNLNIDKIKYSLYLKWIIWHLIYLDF
jgi:hypothetical protein